MKRYLIITEKKSIQKNIEDVYEKNKGALDYVADFIFIGGPVTHITDTVMKVDTTDEYWKKLVLKNTKIPEGYYNINTEYSAKQFEKIKSLINTNNYDCIVNACEPDMYGQLSYEYIKESIGFTIEDKRMWFYSLTDIDILNALQKFEDNNEVLTAMLKRCQENKVYY